MIAAIIGAALAVPPVVVILWKLIISRNRSSRKRPGKCSPACTTSGRLTSNHDGQISLGDVEDVHAIELEHRRLRLRIGVSAGRGERVGVRIYVDPKQAKPYGEPVDRGAMVCNPECRGIGLFCL